MLMNRCVKNSRGSVYACGASLQAEITQKPQCCTCELRLHSVVHVSSLMAWMHAWCVVLDARMFIATNRVRCSGVSSDSDDVLQQECNIQPAGGQVLSNDGAT